MKNIGIITHNFPYNSKDRQNAGIFVNDIAQEMAIRNNVTVLCPAGGKRKNKLAKVNIVNFYTMSGNKLGDLKVWRPMDLVRFATFFVGGFLSLPKFIKENNIEVNISMWSFPSGVFAYIAKKIYRIPYMCWCLGSDIYIYAKKPILKNIIKLVLGNSDFIFADGIDLSREVEKLTGKKCVFVPSASKANYRNNVIQKTKKIINLVFVGRMERVKGPDILFQALELIKKDLSKFKIHYIGDGSMLESLKNKSLNMGMSKQIRFYGNISNFQKISDIIRMSDWLVIPSRSDSIPLIFSEAMKCKTPIIVSNLPDLKYLINKYKVGKSFRKDDFKELASIITKLPKLYKERSLYVKNTKTAANDFSVEESTRKVEFYIQKL